MADAHAEFESRLLANGYEPQPERNILDECEFKDSRTGKFVKLTKEELQELCETRNQLVADKHSAAAICLGHTKDNVEEGEQPPVAGVATRWRLGKYKNGTFGVWIKPWESPEHRGEMKKHPGASVELWLNPNDVNPIAFLKSTTPRRDLEFPLDGPRHFGRAESTSSGRSTVRFSREQSTSERQPILFAMKNAAKSETCPRCGDPFEQVDGERYVPDGENEDRLCATCRKAKGKDQSTTKMAKRFGRLDIDSLHKKALSEPHRPEHWHALADALDESGDSAGASTIRKLAGSAKRESEPEADTPHIVNKQARNQMDKTVKFEDPGMPVRTDDASASPTADTSDADDAGFQKLFNTAEWKTLMAKVNEFSDFAAQAKPIFDQIAAEEAQEAGPGGPGGAPGAGAPPGAGEPPGPDTTGGPPPAGGSGEPDGDEGGAPAPDKGAPPEEDEDEGPAKRNSAGSPAGYGNTSMPNYADHKYNRAAAGYGADPETAIRMQRQEQEILAFKRREAEWNTKLAEQAKETAALRLQRMEDETAILLDTLDREGVTIDREYDFQRLVRMSKADRAKDADLMRKLRAKKAKDLPNDGKKAIPDDEVAKPTAIQFAKYTEDDAPLLGGDPALKTDIPDSYDDMVVFAGNKYAAGRNPLTPVASAAPANGVKVR